ncbi:MAG: PKD domain-containing protein [Candidatus Kariarchaeaceae archaeon]|jgi:PKD repeat protein
MKSNKLTMLLLVVLLGLSTFGVTITIPASTNLTYTIETAQAPQNEKPVFRSVTPDLPTEYGYVKDTEVNITYYVVPGDVPGLMGSFNGWSTDLAMTMSSTNGTHQVWTVNMTLTGTVEFKARNNANWDYAEDVASNHVLLVEGAEGVPDVLKIDNAVYLGPNGPNGRWYAEAGTEIRIWASILNANQSGNMALIGDMTLNSTGGVDHANQTYPMIYNNTVFPTAATNISYWKVNFTMTSSVMEFKIARFAAESIAASGLRDDWWWWSEAGLENNILSPFKLETSQPILVDVEGATWVQDRINDPTNWQGAKYRTSIGDNLTIWYKIFTLDNCTAQACLDNFDAKMTGMTLELHGEDGGFLGWVQGNKKEPFTYNNTIIANLTHYDNITAPDGGTYIGVANYTNVAVANFYINYTIAAETVKFKAYYPDHHGKRYDGPDDPSGQTNNQLLAGAEWSNILDVATPVFNVGTFNISVSATYYTPNPTNPDIIQYGLWTGDPNGEWKVVNFTGSLPDPVGTDWAFDIQVDTDDHAIVAGKDGANAQGVIRHYDLGLKKYVDIYIGGQNFVALDGLPVVDLTGEASQGLAVSVDWSTTDPANSTIDALTLDWGDGTVDDLLASGLSLDATAATHTYSADGTFSVVIKATSPPGGEAIKTLEVTADGTDPSASIDSPEDGDKVDDKVVTFEFTITDAGSGVDTAILDYGDGTSDDVTGTSSKLHQYDDEGDYTVTLTVTDNAGNEKVVSISIEVKEEGDDGFLYGFTTPLFLFGIAVAAVIVRKRR